MLQYIVYDQVSSFAPPYPKCVHFSTCRATMQKNLKHYGVHVTNTSLLTAKDITRLRQLLNQRIQRFAKIDMTRPATWKNWPEPQKLRLTCFETIGNDKEVTKIMTKMDLVNETQVIGVDLQPPAMLKPVSSPFVPSILSRDAPFHGCLQLTAQDINVGSIWVLSGSHHLYDRFCRTQRSIDDPDAYKVPLLLTPKEMDWYVKEVRKLGYSGIVQRVVASKAGQVALWDSRLVCGLYMPATTTIPESEAPTLAEKAMKNVHVLDKYWRQAVYFNCHLYPRQIMS